MSSHPESAPQIDAIAIPEISNFEQTGYTAVIESPNLLTTFILSEHRNTQTGERIVTQTRIESGMVEYTEDPDDLASELEKARNTYNIQVEIYGEREVCAQVSRWTRERQEPLGIITPRDRMMRHCELHVEQYARKEAIRELGKKHKSPQNPPHML